MAIPLQHVSLFSGVGGIDRAMASAGIPTIASCEIDRAARGVLSDRSPDVHLFTDVKEVAGDGLRTLGLNPRRTVLSAGFPCQDVSVAGRRRGMGEGTRSGLYWEVDRILGQFAPAWVVLENVPGLLSATCPCPGDGLCVERAVAVRCDGELHAIPGGACWGRCISEHGGVMGAVLGSLAERGYGFAYRVLDAQHFGVPQRRRRVVVVGRLGDDGRAPAQVLLEPEGVRGNPAAGIAPRPRTTPRAGGGTKALGVLGDVAHTLTAEGHDASEDGTGRGTPVVVAPQIAATLTAGTSAPGVSAPGRRQEDDFNLAAFDDGNEVIVRRLTPMECERLQGFPDGHTATSWGKAQADSPRYKQMGNAVAVPVFEWVARRLAAVDAANAA